MIFDIFKSGVLRGPLLSYLRKKGDLVQGLYYGHITLLHRYEDKARLVHVYGGKSSNKVAQVW